MDEKEITYISFDEFVNNSGVKESTIKRRYKLIPGITKSNAGFTVVSGTRYPCDLHRNLTIPLVTPEGFFFNK